MPRTHPTCRPWHGALLTLALAGLGIVTAAAATTAPAEEPPLGTKKLKGHTNKVLGVCFSPDGKRLASGSWDDTVRVWDAHTGQETLQISAHAGGVSGVCFSPDGKRLASACCGATAGRADPGAQAYQGNAFRRVRRERGCGRTGAFDNIVAQDSVDLEVERVGRGTAPAPSSPSCTSATPASSAS